MLKFVKTQRLIAINSLWKRCSWFQNSLICDKVFSKNWNRENYSLSYTMIHTSSIRPCHKMETMFSQCLPNLKNFFVPNSHNYKHFKHLPCLILFSLRYSIYTSKISFILKTKYMLIIHLTAIKKTYSWKTIFFKGNRCRNFSSRKLHLNCPVLAKFNKKNFVNSAGAMYNY